MIEYRWVKWKVISNLICTLGIGRKNLVVTEEDKLTTAYHEGGHALISLLTKGATPLHKVTILPRGGALGYVKLNKLIKNTLDCHAARKR